MRLKIKPKKPVRKNDIEDSFYLDVCERINLDDINYWRDYIGHKIKIGLYSYLKKYNITGNDYHSIYLEINSALYEIDDLYIIGTRKETDIEFQERLDKYEKDIAAYDKWYQKNKDAIEKEEFERKRCRLKKLKIKKHELKN